MKSSRIIFIMGVSGSGKTTIGKLLSSKTGIPFFDGDDLHSPANKKKMERGYPLNDDDRETWLRIINSLALNQQTSTGAIIACSALKEKYRQILSEGIINPSWVFLNGSFQLIKERMKNRKGHFMPPALLSSQFDILEIPQGALYVDIRKTPGEIVEVVQKIIR